MKKKRGCAVNERASTHTLDHVRLHPFQDERHGIVVSRLIGVRGSKFVLTCEKLQFHSLCHIALLWSLGLGVESLRLRVLEQKRSCSLLAPEFAAG